MTNPIPRSVKQAVRDKYAWPGGYPLFVLTFDCAALCVQCVRDNWREVCADSIGWQRGNFHVVGAAVNWEDNDLTCDHCNAQIEPAYPNED